MIRVKRVYDKAGPEDGFRVFVERFWPRDLTEKHAKLDLWLKDVAPSDALRRRFHAKPADWKEFVAAYGRELKSDPARSAAAGLREQLRHGPVTLLYASRDEVHNNAVALKLWLERR